MSSTHKEMQYTYKGKVYNLDKVTANQLNLALAFNNSSDRYVPVKNTPVITSKECDNVQE